MLTGRNSIGMDILSIATLVSKVKTTPIIYNINEVPKLIQKVKDIYSNLRDDEIRLPPIYNVDYWFTKEIQRQLTALREVVMAEPDVDRRDFLKVCLSSIVRKVSLSGDMETHLHIKEGKKPANAIKLFEARILDMATRMKEFVKSLPETPVKTEIYCLDNREMLNILKENCVDYIFTSPPYGTGTKYASVYRLHMQLLELAKPIRPHDQAKDFALELGKTFGLMYRMLKTGGLCSILYGTNNSFSSADILHIAENQGFVYKETILCPVVDESKMIRGDYKRSMPNEHLITLYKAK
jgi:hypothetical protein